MRQGTPKMLDFLGLASRALLKQTRSGSGPRGSRNSLM